MTRPTSSQLHRAKRKKELHWRDDFLRIAGLGVEEALEILARAQLAARSNPEITAQIKKAKGTIKSVGIVLRFYYDNPEPE
jgi:hypothetical protein